MHHITLNISDSTDSLAEKNIASTLQDLVNGTITPDFAAHAIDSVIISECQEAYKSYTNSTQEHLANGTIEEPSPSGWSKYLWDCMGRSAMVVPADHPGQVLLVQMLQQLQCMPPHTAPELYGDKIIAKTLWVLTARNGYDGLEQWMWELDQGHFNGHGLKSEHTVAYLNFSAFLACLLAHGIAEVTRLSALIRPSPFGARGPSYMIKQFDSATALHQYEGYASAAAQWILYAGNALYEMCQKDVLIEIGKQRWTMNVWESWKTKFDAISKDARFTPQIQELARKTTGMMGKIETEDMKGNIVEQFGFMSLKDNQESEE
ncbi:hypothetical protein K435DRAFT_846183 [Dendrothele bispora CBS 962.96]|uniref:Uncharacterized protein n=1 Tax=Dendrothele bispora (strain CBS 962.96) TaxID=1314807 RepID=A0A4S8KPJ1_DENBC|nr:hypothetical protein K435DRAFT_846183 [Dendrothele bispora CBS 962.96]